MKSLTFTIPLPPSVNRLYTIKRRRLILSEEGESFKHEAGWIARIACRDADFDMVERETIALTVDIYMRAGDGDNRLKALQDAFNGIVWRDDSQIKSGIWRVHKSKQQYVKVLVEVIE